MVPDLTKATTTARGPHPPPYEDPVRRADLPLSSRARIRPAGSLPHTPGATT